MHAKYTTAKIKKHMKKMKLYTMRGGIRIPELPEWLKTSKRKEREAAEKAAAEKAAAEKEAAEKAAAEKAAAEKAAAEKAAAAREERKLVETCGSDISTILNDSLGAIEEINLVRNYFRSLNVNNYDGEHMFEADGYTKKRQEIKDMWLKTNPNLENLEKSFKKLSEIREELMKRNNECRSKIEWGTHFSLYDSIMKYGAPGVNIDTIWEILLPEKKLPCNLRAHDRDCK